VSKITAAMAALKTALETVAAVRVGRAALETTSATLPIITVVSLNDGLAPDQDYDDPTYTRRAIVEYKLAATATYPAAMDTALQAIRAVLVQSAVNGQWLGGHAVNLRAGGVAFRDPEPNGADAAFQVNIEIDYSE
jgi:hypothetical protein